MPKLHPLCTDHAVVCARCPVIMGTAAPGSVVSVTLAGAMASATADNDGR